MTHAHDDEVREQPAVTAAGAGAVTAGAAPSSRDRFCRTAFGPTAATTAAAQRRAHSDLGEWARLHFFLEYEHTMLIREGDCRPGFKLRPAR